MKDTRRSTSWVPIVAGLVGLVALSVAVRQCGSSSSPDATSEPKLAARAPLADTERGGWIAQPRAKSGGATGERGRLAAGSERMADSGSSRSPHSGDPEEFAPSRRAAGELRDAGSHDFEDTNTVDVGGDSIGARQRVPANGARASGADGGNAGEAPMGSGDRPGAADRTGAAPDQGARPKSNAKNDTAETQPVADPADPLKAAAADNTDPVVSLPLDAAVEPSAADTAPIIATGVTIDTNGANFAADGRMYIPSSENLNPAAGTFSFWIQPDWAGETDNQAQILHCGPTTYANHIEIFKDFRYLRFLFTPNSGFESGGGKDIANWQKGDPHMVSATWGDGVTQMYIDGVSVAAKEYEGELDMGASPQCILGAGNPHVPAGTNKFLGRLLLYTRALGADEINTLFNQGPS